MKTFTEWLLNENVGIADNHEYNKVEILGWSLSQGTLPPWGEKGDDALDPTAVFHGRSDSAEGSRVWQAVKPIKDRRDGARVLQYMSQNVRFLRNWVRNGSPRIRQLQYSLMTGKQDDPPDDFVAPDVTGRGGAAQPAQQAQKEAGHNQAKCPKCGTVFGVG